MAVRVDVGEHICTNFRVGHVWVLDTNTMNEFAVPFQICGRDHDDLLLSTAVDSSSIFYRENDGASGEVTYSSIAEDDQKLRTLGNMHKKYIVVGIICHIEFTQLDDSERQFYGRVYVEMNGECSVRAMEMCLLKSYNIPSLDCPTFMNLVAYENGKSKNYRLFSVYISMRSRA